MTESEILDRVADILSQQFSLDKANVRSETGPEDVDTWDSLSHVALTSTLENEFDVSFEIEEIMEMENVGSIVRLLSGKLA